MKIVFLNGSARPNGNTNYLLSQIVKFIDQSAIQAELINISEKNINYCLGCHKCEETRTCVQKDDVDKIYDSFRSADLICIASPSYWGDITGQLKVFIDRSTPYCNTINGKTTFPRGKKSCILAIRAGSNKIENETVIKSIAHYLSHLEIPVIFSETFESIRKFNDYETVHNTVKIKEVANRIIELGKLHITLAT